MKLWLSKANERSSRHLILDVSYKEDWGVHYALKAFLLGGANPIRKPKRDKVQYHLPKEYLNKLLLMFPQAEYSSGLDSTYLKSEQITYAPEDIPELDLPGFHAERLLPNHDLFPFQKVSIAQLIEREIPLTDSMGLGKTVQALAVICNLQKFPVLVSCPNSAKWVWESHISKYTDLSYQIVDGTASQRREQIEADVDILVINFEALRLHPELSSWVWPVHIIDEFHRIKNPSAQATRAAKEIEADRVIPMSGTPIINRPEEAWVILNKLWPQKFPSYYLFCKNLVITSPGLKRWKVGYQPERMQKLQRFIHKNSIRRRKEQVMDELPEEIFLEREVELYPEQKALYKEILKEGKLRLANGEMKKVTDYRTVYMRLRQACFSPELYGGTARSAKMDEIKLLVRDLVDANEKAIIFSQWKRATQIIKRELAEYNPAYVDSTVRGRDRKEQEIKFNEDPTCHVYIGTIGANREAISLSAATYVIFADEDWSPQYNDQAKGRSAAGGLRGLGKDKVTIIRVYARGTVDRKVSELLRTKLNLFNAVVERDSGRRERAGVLTDLRALLEEA